MTIFIARLIISFLLFAAIYFAALVVLLIIFGPEHPTYPEVIAASLFTVLVSEYALRPIWK
jgi:hypothetical protein